MSKNVQEIWRIFMEYRFAATQYDRPRAGLKSRLVRAAALLALPLTLAGAAGAAPYKPVTDARLAAAASDDGWLMYRHDYGSSGYSKLSQINANSVAGLKQVWDFKSSFTQGHEAPPVVNGDYMFIIAASRSTAVMST